MSHEQDEKLPIWQLLTMLVIVALVLFVALPNVKFDDEIKGGPIPVAVGNMVQPKVVWASPGFRVHTFVSTTQGAGEGKMYLQMADGTRCQQLLVNGRLPAIRFGPSQYGLMSNGQLSVDVPDDARRGDRVVFELSILEDLCSSKVLEVQNYLLAVIR